MHSKLGQTVRWTALVIIVLAIILIPWVLFGAKIESWTEALLQNASRYTGWIALLLSALLASDIFVPVPSSLVSTALGLFLGFVGGTLASWVAMMVSCAIGYWLALLGRPIIRRLVGEEELNRLQQLTDRFGRWVIVICRPVPVLAEASIIFAGMSKMQTGQFMLLVALSNLGISAVYAAVGAFSANVSSFLLAFAGAILLPLVAMTTVRLAGRRLSASSAK